MSSKRLAIIGISTASLLLFGAFGYFSYTYLLTLRTYKPIPLERVLNEERVAKVFGVDERKNPSAFGFAYSEETYISKLDNLKLSGWFMPAKREDSVKRCLVFVHGRSDNRMMMMKYLELVRTTGLDSSYAVFMGDMRNAGKSDSSMTDMGYENAEDILYTLDYLHTQKKITHVVIFAHSMGAMATSILFHRPDLQADVQYLQQSGMTIDKVILDSPLANVRDNVLNTGATTRGIPLSVMNQLLWLFDVVKGGYLDSMRLSVTLRNVHIPILITQMRQDSVTPTPILERELSLLQNASVRVKYFPKGAHVRGYLVPEQKEEFTRTIAEFIHTHR
jgi:pimeloyl-ACP methyl ester carboxylesterase